MRTIDRMSARDLQDLRDAGRGHLIDGIGPYLDKADELRKRAKEEPACPDDGNLLADDGVCGFCGNRPPQLLEDTK